MTLFPRLDLDPVTPLWTVNKNVRVRNGSIYRGERVSRKRQNGFTLTGIDSMLPPPVSKADCPRWFSWLLVLVVGCLGGAIGWFVCRTIDIAIGTMWSVIP